MLVEPGVQTLWYNNSKMKIGLVQPYSIIRGGGVQEYVYGIQRELKARGHEAVIITPQPRNYREDPPQDVLFLGGSTDFKSPFATTAQLSVTVNTDRVEQVLEEQQFDVLHFHEPWIPIIGRQILARSSVPNVATFHAKLPDTFMSRTIEKVITPYTKSILKYLDVLTAVSGPASVYIQQLTDVPITIVPNGIDTKKYHPRKLDKLDHPTIFYVGRLEKRKGVNYLIMAFAELVKKMPDAHLLIGGDGSDREALEAFVSDNDIPNVRFLGYVDEEEKIRYLQTADVFCSPAIYGESFGIVLLEAVACGIPTVAGANPGYEYFLQGRGELGLVNPKDTADFARRLHIFLTDETLRKAWKDWAKEYIIQFNYPHIVDSYLELYQQAMRRR